MRQPVRVAPVIDGRTLTTLTLVHELAHATLRVLGYGTTGALEVTAPGVGSAHRAEPVDPEQLVTASDRLRELVCMAAGPWAEVLYWQRTLKRTDPVPDVVKGGWGAEREQLRALCAHFPEHTPTAWLREAQDMTLYALDGERTWHAITSLAHELTTRPLPIRVDGVTLTENITTALDAYDRPTRLPHATLVTKPKDTP